MSHTHPLPTCSQNDPSKCLSDHLTFLLGMLPPSPCCPHSEVPTPQLHELFPLCPFPPPQPLPSSVRSLLVLECASLGDLCPRALSSLPVCLASAHVSSSLEDSAWTSPPAGTSLVLSQKHEVRSLPCFISLYHKACLMYFLSPASQAHNDRHRTFYSSSLRICPTLGILVFTQ